MNNQVFWNPVLETLPRESLQQLQLKKFKRIFEWAFTHSKFHRSIYDDAGITPDDIKSLEDIKRIPKVEKSMMRGIQCKDTFPYGDASKRYQPLDKPVVQQGSRSIKQTPGMIGSGGRNAGLIFYGPRGIVQKIVFLSHLDTISLLLFGRAIMQLKN